MKKAKERMKYMVVQQYAWVRTYAIHGQTKRRLDRLVHPDNLRKLVGRDMTYTEARALVKLLAAAENEGGG